MRIDPSGKPASAAPLRTRRNQSGFALPETSNDTADAAGTETTEAATPTSSVAQVMLAGPDAPPPPPPSDAAAAQHGTDMLNALSRLQLALLDGGGASAGQSLAALAQSIPTATNPGLQAVLQSVAVRAAVELARSE